jgi:hypothetical protein
MCVCLVALHVDEHPLLSLYAHCSDFVCDIIVLHTTWSTQTASHNYVLLSGEGSGILVTGGA